MKISYNRDEDIMLLEVAPDRIDFAEEMGPIIVHFSEGRKPVLLEILDASEFIASAARSRRLGQEMLNWLNKSRERGAGGGRRKTGGRED